jgi:hypothetical protein
MKNTFGISVYSEEYTFPILLYGRDAIQKTRKSKIPPTDRSIDEIDMNELDKVLRESKIRKKLKQMD